MGAVLLVSLLPTVEFAQPYLFLALISLATLSSALKVNLPFDSSVSSMSASYALGFASLILLGPHETMLVAATSAYSQCCLNRKDQNPVHRTLFSMASLIVTVECAGLAYKLLQAPDADAVTALARPLAGAATTYFLVNTGLVAAAISLTDKQNFLTVWRQNFLWSAPSYFVGAGTAAVAAWSIGQGGLWVAPFMLAPILLIYHTYTIYMGRLDARRQTQETADLHLATIEALAGAIDAKDQMTNAHILRVQFFAVGLAEAVGLSADDIQGVKTAALLHDIGKLAVPEHILSKPGPLTPEEFQKVRIHPRVGAEIIAGVLFPYPVAPLILNHHERWDGKGYPSGVSGEAIPIGARILTVVDYYDAVTSERPYHNALSRESAVNLLRHEAGRALDPSLVDIFIKLLPGLVAGLEATRPAMIAPVALDTPESLIAAQAAAAEDSRAMAFENIGLAHREIYALYEIAQSMGTSVGVADTMAVISSKLAKIIPWSGVALFLQQQDVNELHCRYATGIDAPRLEEHSIRVGEGLSGWVARNRRVLVNASPRVEFEAAGVSVADMRVQSAIVCPLYLGDGFIGSLALFHVEANCYTDDHRRLIGSVAEQAGAVIHNSIVFEQAQEDSLTDPLTSLPNRRSLFARLSHELARATRLQSELALIVLDIDEFKRINDSYGHHVGDDGLRAVAGALRTALRQYDMCVRFAGDEFIVVVSDSSREAAETKRQELQQRISEIEIAVFPGQHIRLGASAGAAVFPHDGRTYEELMAEADRRMYQDKSARRGLSAPVPVAPAEEWAGVAAGLPDEYTPPSIRYE